MKYFVFDTETSGLFNFRLPADDPTQPRLAQFSGIVTNEDLTVDREINLFVQPDGWEVGGEAAAKNGLTTEFLSENGRPILEVLDVFTGLVDEGHSFAAFNAQFDLKMMRGELRRADLDDRFEQTFNSCLMRACGKLGIKKASGKGGFPKLSDVCEHFGIINEAEHDGLADARAAYEILLKLHESGDLLEPAVHYAKNHQAA